MDNRTKRALINTVILYIKVLLGLFISIVTTRIVLDTLGVEDFGTYNVVVGMVAMLAFVNLAMSTSTLRYNSYYLGKPEAQDVFNNTVLLHLILAAGIFVLLEIIGGLFIENLLNVEHSRLGVVKIIFQFVVLGCVIHVITVPFDSLINAHEHMLAYSIIEITTNLLTLACTVSLYFVVLDKLLVYSIVISLIPVIILIIKIIYCRKCYPETKSFSLSIKNKKRFKEMGSFSTWNMFGAFSNAAKNQGTAMILNVFFGVAVNAAYGISQQVNSVCLLLSGSLQKSLNPVILKSEGNGDRSSTIRYALLQCRLSCFLVALIVLPLYCNLKYILTLWLNNVPAHTLDMCQLLIILTIILQMTTGIQVAIQSVGKIKYYQICMSIIIFANIPLSILFLQMGFRPEVVFGIAIALEIICIIVRLLFARKLLNLKFKLYWLDVVKPCLSIILAMAIIVPINKYFPTESFWIFLIKATLAELLLGLGILD